VCAHHCAHCCMHNTAQNRSDIFPFMVQVITRAQMTWKGRKPVNDNDIMETSHANNFWTRETYWCAYGVTGNRYYRRDNDEWHRLTVTVYCLCVFCLLVAILTNKVSHKHNQFYQTVARRDSHESTVNTHCVRVTDVQQQFRSELRNVSQHLSTSHAALNHQLSWTLTI